MMTGVANVLKLLWSDQHKYMKTMKAPHQHCLCLSGAEPYDQVTSRIVLANIHTQCVTCDAQIVQRLYHNNVLYVWRYVVFTLNEHT